jgi:hypothetical protein
MIGLVGVSEEYNHSLELIESLYGLSLPQLSVNVNDKPQLETFDEELNKLVMSKNQKDMVLYRNAKRIFEERYSYLKSGVEWVYGAIAKVDDGSVSGWAYFQSSDRAVTVELYINDKYIDSMLAVSYRPHLATMNPERRGYIGFAFKTNLSSGDKVKVRVLETGQWLSERVIKEN